PVIVARDGVEALEILEQGRHDGHDANGPIVVLLDNKMPRMTGLELLQKMKSDPRLKHIPVVMMTSSRAEPDLERAYALGVNAYVVKPVDFKEFTEAVKLVGRFWAILNEPPVHARSGESASARSVLFWKFPWLLAPAKPSSLRERRTAGPFAANLIPDVLQIFDSDFARVEAAAGHVPEKREK